MTARSHHFPLHVAVRQAERKALFCALPLRSKIRPVRSNRNLTGSQQDLSGPFKLQLDFASHPRAGGQTGGQAHRQAVRQVTGYLTNLHVSKVMAVDLFFSFATPAPRHMHANKAFSFSTATTDFV